MPDQIAVPASIELERDLLGEAILRPSALPLCLEVGLDTAHFYTDTHRALWRAVRHADALGDELAVWASVERLGLVGGALSRSLVSEIAASATFGDARFRARRVMELAGRRAKLEGADLIRRGAVELDEARSADLIAEGMALVTRDVALEAEPTSREEIADEIFDFFDERAEPEEVFALPWPALNEGVLGGLRRGDVTVLAAHTNQGKSWLLDQCLAGWAAEGRHCAIFATEMPRRQRALRYIAAATGIPLARLMLKRDLDARDMSRIVKAIPTFPFDYYECHGWGADRIAERILATGVDVAAIDVFNKIPGVEETRVASAAATRFAEVTARARIHLIVVSHLNRHRLRDPRGVLPRPLAHDLRDTAMLETHAAQILFIHRDQDDSANIKATGEVYWGKVRNGYRTSVKVEQSPRRLWFFERDDSPPQQEIDLGPEKPAHDREVFA